jgi:esterase/lipase superfamily enzyme
MKNFLKDYLTKTEAKNMYLMAHSIGKRATDRETLERVSKATVTYWKVKKRKE